MPVRLCAARQAARNTLHSPTGHVWISDQLLQDTISSFTGRISGCKRHGSHVPGPLESRRRLAKRQLGHLAAVGQAGSPPVDPTLLTFGWFGNTRGTSAEQDIKWLPPGAQGAIRTGKHTYPKLPSWLDVKHPSSDTSSLDIDQILGPQPQLQEVTLAQYKIRLSRAKNLEDVKRLNEELGSAILDAERCSVAAFNHLLARYTMMRSAHGARDADVRSHRSELFQFLEDPQLERSNLCNLHAFTSILVAENAEPKDVLFIFRQLKAFTTSFKSSKILSHLLKVAIPLTDRLDDRGAVIQVLQDIWHATKDMHSRARIGKLLFRHISNMPPGMQSLDLACDILQSLRPSLDYARLLNADLQDDMSSWRRTIGTFARHLMIRDKAREESAVDDGQTLHTKQSPTLSRLLCGLPHEYVGTFAAAVTLTLVEDLQTTTESDVAISRLCTWSQTLRSTTNRSWTSTLPRAILDNIYQRMADVARPGKASFAFETMKGTQIAQTLLQHWLAENRTVYAQRKADMPVATNPLRAATLKKTWHKSSAYLERVASEWLNSSQIALVALVDSSKLHQLDWESLLDDILGLLERLDRKQDFIKVAAGWKRIQKGSCFTIQHRSRLSKFIDQCGTYDAFRALRVLQLDKRNFLSQYSGFMEKLSQCPVVKPNDILALLHRHDRHLSMPIVEQKQKSSCKLTSERVELVQALALELATNERFNHRQASSGVHFCWKYLKSNQASLDERMAEAVVVAGVLRPFAAGQWVPRKQFRWVAKVVEELCGIDAVEALDRFAFDLRPKLSYEMLGHALGEGDEVRHSQSIDWRSLPVPKPWHEGFIGPQNLSSTKRMKTVAEAAAEANA